jgi:AraC family transcriptional regulator
MDKTSSRFTSSTFPDGTTIVAKRQVGSLVLCEAVYPARLRVPTHSHDGATLCMALGGGCTEHYSRKQREYEPFSLMFLPCDHVHSLIFKDVPLRCFTVDVASATIGRMRDVSLRFEESRHCNGGHLAWLVMRLHHEFLQPDQASALAIEGLVLEILASISRPTEPEEASQSRWLGQVRELLHTRFAEPVTLDNLSQAVSVHPVHIARTFRRRYGISVGGYLRRLRIEHACRQMLDPAASLVDIALTAGFADQSHFSRTFKKIVGTSPSQFRSSLLRR